MLYMYTIFVCSQNHEEYVLKENVMLRATKITTGL